ncbi:type IV pilus modification protein PilV [Pseudomonas sp. zfem001]|uniref:type IV pilus modification protein PilV n=1 Tax=Pseudomonas sp. zfem001 TaxID=3078196 RepID=UPI00292812CB|nr:type IV pilus modification protein PilV [Pseudomonas sp. zfem001]MDU9406660.1 type IV pilus modification protein PilV [Pseudomonas sp. zfem001]
MKRKAENGFSMIEVLVTLVLISVGVLGMVALQTRTIQYTQDSAQRNVAIILANDLAEMMRAMPTGFPNSSGFYKAGGANFPEKPDDCTPLPNNAAGQLACWADKVEKMLPVAADTDDGDSLLKSDFHICRTNTANSCTGTGTTVEIQIAWRGKAGECIGSNGAASSICHYRLRTQI